MKNKLFIPIFLFALIIKAQVPQTINYQGVARDASGNPIANQTVGLQFNISTSANANFYNETQPSVQTNSLGLFSTKIGLINPLPLTGWQNLPAVMQISININNTSFVSLGAQTLASVPYALYALTGGNALPLGIRDGQTLRWDSTAQVWKKSNNITNDDIRVGVGLFPNEIKSKMHVTTFNSNDSSAFAAVHFNATDKQSALKAFAVGSTNSNSLNPYNTAIYGSQNAADNSGSGFSIGSFNYGTSNGTGVGAYGVGNSKTAVGTAIGVYGTTDPGSLGTNRYAGIFDKGAVLINDSLMLGTFTNPGLVGDVLTRSNNGRAKWQTPGSFFSPFTISANFVHLVPANANSKVVIGNTTPTLFGYGSKLTVYNPVGTNDTALSVFQNTTAHALYAISKNISITSYAGFFDGGLISRGKNSLPGSFGFIVKDAANVDLFVVKNNGNVGIKTNAPVNPLHVNGAVTITDGSQAAGKVFTSDALGNGSWQPISNVSTFAFNTQVIAATNTVPILLANLSNYNKIYNDTKIEVIVQTHIAVEDLFGANAVKYELRINGAPASGNTGRTNYFIDNNGSMLNSAYDQVTMIGEFTGLATGALNIQIWVYTLAGSASGVYLDPGNYGASGIIVKEYR